MDVIRLPFICTCIGLLGGTLMIWVSWVLAGGSIGDPSLVSAWLVQVCVIAVLGVGLLIATWVHFRRTY